MLGGGTGHGKLGAHGLPPAGSGSRQRWEVGLEANTGSGWARTRGQCPSKGCVWQAWGNSKEED